VGPLAHPGGGSSIPQPERDPHAIDSVYAFTVPKPLRLTACLPLALAVIASGCGSTKTASTSTTASTNAGTSAPSNGSSQTATHSTSSNEARQRSEANKQKAAKARLGRQAKGSQRSTEAAKPKTQAAKGQAPPKLQYLYPLDARQNFIATCMAAKGSKSGCECIIAKYESRKVVEGQSLAELLGVEVGLKDGFRLPPRARQYVKECSSTIQIL
jgi:hypothetical protein